MKDMKSEYDPTPASWMLFCQSLRIIIDLLENTKPKYTPTVRNQMAIKSLIEENLCAIYGTELEVLKD